MTEPKAEGAEGAQRLIQKRSGHTGPRTACTNHCATCGGHFSSLSAFDAHRRGNHQDGTRHCDGHPAMKAAVAVQHGLLRDRGVQVKARTYNETRREK